MAPTILSMAEIGDPEPSGEDNDEYGSIDVDALLEEYDEGDVDVVHAQGLTQNPITSEDDDIDIKNALKEYVANVNSIVEFSNEVGAKPLIGESVNDIGLMVDPEGEKVDQARRLHSDLHQDEELEQEIWEDALDEEFEDLGIDEGYHFEGAEHVEDEQDFREFVIEYFDSINDDFDVIDGKYSQHDVQVGGQNAFSLVSGSAHSEYWSDDPYSEDDLQHIWKRKEKGRETYFEGHGLFGELTDTYNRVTETLGDARSAVEGVADKINRFLNGEESDTDDSDNESHEEETNEEDSQDLERKMPDDFGVDDIEEWVNQPFRDSKKKARMEQLDLPEKHRKKIMKEQRLKELIRDESSGNVVLMDGGLPLSTNPRFRMDKEDGEHRGSLELQTLVEEEGLGGRIPTYVGSYTSEYGQQKKDGADYINTHGTVTEIELDEEGRRVDHAQFEFLESNDEDIDYELGSKREYIERTEEGEDLWDQVEYSEGEIKRAASRRGIDGDRYVSSLENEYENDPDNLDDIEDEMEDLTTGTPF